MRHRWWKKLGFCLVLGMGGVWAFAARGKSHQRVMVLGMDGLDYRLLTHFIEEGSLPNFERLAGERLPEGGWERLKPLETAIPPQSPVAWSNFTTGQDAGVHGIFDFVHRNPRTFPDGPGGIYMSTGMTRKPKSVRLGHWIIPLWGGGPVNLRKGKAFWQYLDDYDIPYTIFRIPANFPPVKGKGRSLSGMGTPDLLGTPGDFSFYTTDPPENADSVTGGTVYPVRVRSNVVQAVLLGPDNSLLDSRYVSKKQQQLQRQRKPYEHFGQCTVPFTVYVDSGEPVAKIEIQDHEIVLQEGEWSDWIRVKFEALPLLASFTGVCRMYLMEVRPEFSLYVTPIQIDPSAPALPISNPPEYSRELYRNLGYFYTQGLPADTKALQEGIFNEEQFLSQARQILRERQKAFRYHLQEFDTGLLFFYFTSSDQMVHMSWHLTDEEHPGHDSRLERMRDIIRSIYQEMDRSLGWAMAEVDPDTTLIVMSDHGFAPYYRGFNVNTWLVKEGYLVLTDESKLGDTDGYENIDWARTKAYGLGLNGIYVSLKGREKYGIVDPTQRRALVDEICEKLLDVVDEEYGKHVVSRAYILEDTYHGPYADPMTSVGPDIQIGYNWGYRASWETGLGQTPPEIIVDNTNKWSGDHCIDHTLVPGVLLSNKTIQEASPSLCSLSRVILAELGITEVPDLGEITGLGEGVDEFGELFTGDFESSDALKSIGYLGGGTSRKRDNEED